MPNVLCARGCSSPSSAGAAPRRQPSAVRGTVSLLCAASSLAASAATRTGRAACHRDDAEHGGERQPCADRAAEHHPAHAAFVREREAARGGGFAILEHDALPGCCENQACCAISGSARPRAARRPARAASEIALDRRRATREAGQVEAAEQRTVSRLRLTARTAPARRLKPGRRRSSCDGNASAHAHARRPRAARRGACAGRPAPRRASSTRRRTPPRARTRAIFATDSVTPTGVACSSSNAAKVSAKPAIESHCVS